MAPGRAEAIGWAPPPWGEGRSDPENIRVALITFGPGDEIASWFGHSAVLVEDREHGQQRVYNYGMFSFGPDLLPKFLMGRLEFWVGEASLTGTLRQYRAMNRSIRIQELNLPPELRERMARALADNARPENRYYLYHHYDDNCATRIRDLVDEVLDGRLREVAEAPGRMTLRDHTRRHSQHNPFINFVLMLLMNSEIDRPITVWDEMFLPEEMERVIADLTYEGPDGEEMPLVRRSTIYFEARDRQPVPTSPSLVAPYTFAIGLLFGGAGMLLARRHARTGGRKARAGFGLYNSLIGIMVGLPAVLLFLMWTITEHTVTYRNENLLLANPVTFLALPLGIAVAAGSSRAARWLCRCWLLLVAGSFLAVILKILPWFTQDNWMVIAMLLPMNLGMAASWLWVRGAMPLGLQLAGEPAPDREPAASGKAADRHRTG